MAKLTVNEEERRKELENMEKCANHYDDEVPYGLHIHLEQRELEKLGLASGDIPVGSEINGLVKLRVTGIRQTENDNKIRRNLDLAIIEMDVENPNQEDKTEQRKNILYR